jgi:hypothetical protein
MKNLRLLFSILFIFIYYNSFCQTDSLAVADSAALQIIDTSTTPYSTTDTLNISDTISVAATSTILNFDSIIFNRHVFYKFQNPVTQIDSVKKVEGKEAVFYLILSILLFFALIKNGFPRYLQDMFRMFFQTSVKQKQLKDQLMQSPLPSLLFNIFFVVTGAFFLTLVLQYYNLGSNFSFWILMFYCALGLIIIYSIKFLFLKLFGWLFKITEATNTYIFIVFTTNKIISIFLIPFIILMSFSMGTVRQSALALSLLIVGFFFLYRFYLAFVSTHRYIKIKFFHFLLYLIAFEIVPLLLINKLLFQFLA